MSQLSLDARVAVVTGAETGTGAAVAMELARRGAAVAVQYAESFTRAKELVRAIERAGGRAVAIKAALHDRAGTELLFKKAGGAFGDVDVVVAIDPPFPVPAVGWDEDPAGPIADAARDRLLAVLTPLYAALPAMAERGTGLLIHAGGAAPADTPSDPAQDTARAATAAAVAHLAGVCGPSGVTVYTVASGEPEDTARAVAALASGGTASDTAAPGSGVPL